MICQTYNILNKMTKLSVNVNKISTLRNARGGNIPNLIEHVVKIEKYGAHGITVHPRPDERHITYKDVYDIKKIITAEFNIEGNPKVEKFVQLVLDVKPTQVTLVPDNENQLTSDHGWDTISEKDYLQTIIAKFKEEGIRTSIFVDPDIKMIEGAAKTGTDRVELYTESYAKNFSKNKEEAIKPFTEAANKAKLLGLEVNAGHDLNLQNLAYFVQNIPFLSEVSIGHALISDALDYGMQKTIELYLQQLNR
jgi:pyridoxine 5-phosphate synthase